MTVPCRQELVNPANKQGISITRQCELLNVSRSGIYYTPREESLFKQDIRAELIETYSDHPYYGSRRLTVTLQQKGYSVGRRRISGMMREMGIQAIYPRPKTSVTASEYKKYPYLLRDIKITHNDQVWSSDITYLHTPRGKMYMVAIIDWYSRKILSWRISNTMDEDFCREALEEAIELYGTPEIFNTDQGSQFTGKKFIEVLLKHKIRISIDGKGRCRDNIIMERFWRSLKQEDVNIQCYETPGELIVGIRNWLDFYNMERPHSSLHYKTPDQVYFKGKVLRSTKETLFPESPLEPPLYPFFAVVKGKGTTCRQSPLD